MAQPIDTRKHPDLSTANQVTWLLLVIYLLVMTWILLFKLGVQFSYMTERRLNLLPFREAFAAQGRLDRMETLLNVCIFIPLGLYVGVLFRTWTLRAKLGVFLMVSLIFETLQYALRIGAFDATDLITNTVGGLLGLLLFMAIEKILGSHRRAQNLVNTVAALGTMAVIVFLLSVKLGIGPIRYQ
jgi:glycopeptide antibiotics resistance protein